MQYYRCQNCLKSHPACRQTMIQALIAAEQIEGMANTALKRRKDTRDREVKIETTCPSYEPRDSNFEERWFADLERAKREHFIETVRNATKEEEE